MPPDVVEHAIKYFLAGIRERLDRAAAVAKAAEACMQAGSTEQAVEIALDIEQQVYEVSTLLNAASCSIDAQSHEKRFLAFAFRRDETEVRLINLVSILEFESRPPRHTSCFGPI